MVKDELIYKIYSVYLYDNQLNHEWLILHNKYKSSFTPGFGNESELGYNFGEALKKIYNLPKDEKKVKSIELISKALSRDKDKLFIKNDGFLTIKKIEDTSNPIYSIYDILWNETRSGIDITKFDYCSPYTPGESSTSCYRIFEEREHREIAFKPFSRDLKLDALFEKAATS